MSDNQNTFSVSQEYEIMPHQKGKAFPISTSEWSFIKNKLKEINIEINIFNKIGFSLLGASIPCLIKLVSTDYKTENPNYWVVAFFGIFIISGILAIYFSSDKHKTEQAKPQEIINHMELIESRFISNAHDAKS